jgi:hypothetical protein
MAISGIILFLAPTGRIARWLDWTFITFSRQQWEEQHTISSYLFFVLALVHLFFINWKIFLSHLRVKLYKGIKRRMELLSAILLTLGLFLATFFNTAPASYVLSLGDSLSNYWQSSSAQPPVPHAELLSFEEFASNVVQVDAKSLANLLIQHGYQISDTSLVFRDIAKENNLTPEELYHVIIRMNQLKS